MRDVLYFQTSHSVSRRRRESIFWIFILWFCMFIQSVLLFSLFGPLRPCGPPPPHAWEAPLSVSPPLRASRQLSRRESQVYARGQRKLCGKTKFFQLCLTTNFAKTDAGTLASPRGGTNSDRCQWQKQGAVSGAALQFLQASAAARRKNRPSARGGGTALCAVTERGGSHVYGGAVMPPCGMTERAISQPPRGELSKNPDKKKNACFRRHFPFYGGSVVGV